MVINRLLGIAAVMLMFGCASEPLTKPQLEKDFLAAMTILADSTEIYCALAVQLLDGGSDPVEVGEHIIGPLNGLERKISYNNSKFHNRAKELEFSEEELNAVYEKLDSILVPAMNRYAILIERGIPVGQYAPNSE